MQKGIHLCKNFKINFSLHSWRQESSNSIWLQKMNRDQITQITLNFDILANVWMWCFHCNCNCTNAQEYNCRVLEIKCSKYGNMKIPTWKIATRMIPTGQFPLGKLPPKKIPTQDKSHLDNSHPGKLPLGKLTPGNFPPRKFPPGKIFIQPIATPDNCHPANLIKFNNI